MKSMVYRWKKNVRTKLDPKLVGQELERIRVKYKTLTPATVVKESRRKGSPLHDAFNWDDKQAASKWRSEQARYLIRSLEVTISKSKSRGPVEASVTVRKYTSLGKGQEDGSDSEYLDTEEVLSDKKLRQQVLLKIWRQLLSLKQQYENYKEFGSVWSAIDESQEDMVRLQA